jgi:alpha-beta hydrolase superfamily lysophospholipase
MTQSNREVEAEVRRHRRWPFAALTALAALVALFYLGGGWYFSSQLNHTGLDAAAKRSATPDYAIEVLRVGGNEVTLRVPPTPGQLLTPGTWGLQWPGGGYGQVTAIRAKGNGSVTRDFRQMTGPPLGQGVRVALDNKAYPQNPQVALGLAYQNVTYQGPLGSYPAWFIPGSADTWAILVHGNSLDRLDTIKIVPGLHEAGLPVLMITYRNDPGAPQGPSDRLRYGATEWQDLQAAIRYALTQGARRVVLVGYSMGGGIVMSFLERSSLAPSVAGVILDSPMLDFGRTVDYGASQDTLPLVGLPVPQSLTDVAKWMAGWRFGVDWGALDYLKELDTVRAPILLFQGTADRTVPIGTSDELARDRPHLVTYIRTPEADHLDSWNLDPGRYDAAVRSFLERVLGSTSVAA